MSTPKTNLCAEIDAAGTQEYCERLDAIDAEITRATIAVSHSDLLRRVRDALGMPVFGSTALALIEGTTVAVRTNTRHEEFIGGDRTRHWWTHRDRVLSYDLEDFADDMGVLAEGERLATAPACSRCRSWEVEIHYLGCYGKQCERCITWSRNARADPNRCADCRREFRHRHRDTLKAHSPEVPLPERPFTIALSVGFPVQPMLHGTEGSLCCGIP
jgi:hypothetical protein